MKLRSFFAGTVEAALRLARDELGTEAMLVNSRKAPPEALHLGQYEVVAAAHGSNEKPGPALSNPAGAELPSNATGDRLSREVAELRRQMERMRKAVWHSGLSRSWGTTPLARQAGILSMLLEAEVDGQLAHEIAACTEACRAGDPLLKAPDFESAHSGGPDDEKQIREALRKEMERRFSVAPTLGTTGERRRMVALVGPPGAGKTTTLAKLVVAEGLRRRRATQVVSMDTYRIAATEPLRTYASLLGVGFQQASTGPSLVQVLRQQHQKDLVLIDTPGFGPRDTEAAEELAEELAKFPEIDVHLVLAGTTKSADLTTAVDRFEKFRPSKLLFTRADETTVFGPVFSQAARTGKPISFLSTGQRVPEDLEEASKDRIIERILARGAD